MKNSISVYVHLPFCRSRCPYCDFASHESAAIPFDDYSAAIDAEWHLRRTKAGASAPISIYIGGGTPSLWPADKLKSLIARITAPLSKDTAASLEITVEANPKDTDGPWFDELVSAGVNRFSIGVQALDDQRLHFLGRRHDRRDAEAAVTAAVRSGARSVNADLIYGTPGQRPAELTDELHALVDLGISHLSAYELTAPKGTRLSGRIRRGEVTLPDQDALATMWHLVRGVLDQRGLAPYETSNYARQGHRCRHNLHYWRGGPYIGLGAAAVGCLTDGNRGMVRYTNTGDVAGYLAAARAAHPPGRLVGLGEGSVREPLPPTVQAQERVMLGLRTTDGVWLPPVLDLLPDETRAKWGKWVADLVEEGMATTSDNGNCLKLTNTGFPLADLVAERFF